MQRKVISDTEHKLVILYILDRFGVLTENQLYNFLAELHLMQWLDLVITKSEMEEKGEVRLRKHPAGDVMEITPAGQYALQTFLHHIPASKRTLIDQETPKWRKLFRAQLSTLVTVLAHRGEHVWYRMRIVEGFSVIMDMTVRLHQASAASKWDEEWQTEGSRIYHAVSAALGEGYVPDALPASLPDTAVVRPVDASTWMVHLMDDTDDPDLTITLITPDKGLAYHEASRWDGCKDGLRTLIRQEMMAHFQAQ